MRVFIMFDLPVLTSKQRRDYRAFVKYLTKSGFLMMQESIYTKITPNATTADVVISGVKRNKPPAGLVQAMKVTERQYEKMDFIVGEFHTDVIDTDERLVVL